MLRCEICSRHHGIHSWIDTMKNIALNKWLDCDDEIKMNSFLENLEDETALRKFAVLNAKSIDTLLVDSRSRNAVEVAEAYANENVSAQELERAYYEAESACDEIEAANDSEDDPTQSEENIDNAALVALWVAYPVGHTGVTSLESARESALHTAFYCFQIHGSRALEEQLERFKEAGLME